MADDFNSPSVFNPAAHRFSAMLSDNPTLVQYPGVATALANSNADDSTAATTGALLKGVQLRNLLDSAGGDHEELAMWNAMPKQYQDLASQAGYQVIVEKKQSAWKRALGGVFHGAGNVVDAVVPDELGHVVKEGASKAMDGWQWANEEKNHVFRAFAEEGLAAMGNGDLKSLPSAWRDTADGDRSFDHDALSRIQGKYDSQTFDLAKRAAMHEDIRGQVYDLVGQAESLEGQGDLAGATRLRDQATALEKQMDSQTFKDALTDINNTKLSFGRVLAIGLGIQNDKAFKVVSGLTDGVWTFVTDPVIVAGQALRGAKAAKYGISAVEAGRDTAYTSKRIEQVFQNPNVQKFWDDIGPHLDTIRATRTGGSREAAGQALTEIKRNYKSALPMLDDLVKTSGDDAVRDAASAETWFKNADGFRALMSGRSAFRRPLMPYRTNLREQAQKLKPSAVLDFHSPEALRLIKDQDFQLTGPMGIGTKAGAEGIASKVTTERGTFRGKARTVLSSFSTKLPEIKDDKLYLSGQGSAQSAQDMERIARMVGPKYWSRQVGAAFMAADVEGRRQIAKGVYATIIESAGIAKASTEGAEWAKRFLKQFDEENGAHYASLHGADVSPLTGRRSALFPENARDYVSVPSFRDFYAQSAKMGLLGHAGHHVTKEGYDWYTQAVFKPSVLLRPALAFRNGLEEITNHIVRVGGADYLQGRVGAKVLSAKGVDPEAGRLFRMVARPVVKLAQAPRLVGLQPLLAPDSWKSGSDMYRAHMMGKLGEAYLSKMNPQALEHLNELAADPWAVRQFNSEILENSRVATRGSIDDLSQVTTKGKFGKMLKAKISSTGDYKLRATDSQAGMYAWDDRIHMVASTRSGELAFQNIDNEQGAVQAIIADMVANPGEYDTSLIRDLRTHMGEDGGNAEFARRVFSEAKHIVSDRNGNLIAPVVDRIAPLVDGARVVNADAADLDLLHSIADADRPASVLGTDSLLIRDQANPIHEFVTRGFKTVGDMTSWISRQPIFVANYLRSRENLRNFENLLKENGTADDVAKQMAHKKATEEAIHETLRYVDNPVVRSQASEIMRNVFPFWRAQEEFYTRWARTFKYAPESIAKAAHILDGAESSGFVKEDDQGNKYFVYPGTGFTYNAVAKTMGVLKLPVLQVPVSNMFTGQVQFLNSGLDPRGVYPSAGPIFSFPLQFMRDVTGSETLLNVEKKFLGQQGAGRDPFLAQLPTPVRRAVTAFASDKEQSAAMKQAMAYLEYAGKGLPEDASPAMKDAYLENVRRWSKGILAMRVIYGLAAPTPFESEGIAPAADPDAQRLGLQTVRDEFRDMVNKVGYEAAMGYWVKEHPDLLPFTVAATKATAGGAVVPATQLAGDFIDQNSAMFTNNPKAAGYWLPQAGGTFDHNVYADEMSMGLRKSKTVDEFYGDLKMAGEMDYYYSQQDKHQSAQDNLRAKGMPLTDEADGWSTWKDNYMKLHPLMADYLSQGSTRQRDRESTMLDMRNLLESGKAPAGETTDMFRKILNAYDKHRQFQTDNGGSDDYSISVRRSEATRFSEWVQSQVANNPSGKMFYNKLLRYADQG
jgi:hypothetical protein